MSSPEPNADSSTDITAERSEDHSTASTTDKAAETVTSFVTSLWIAVVVNAVGVAIALLPPRWGIAGVIVAGLGTMLFAGFSRADVFTAFAPGSHERVRGGRAALTGIIYGTCVIAAGITATMVPPYSVGLGITFSVMALVPVILGVRALFAVHDRNVFQEIGANWTHGVASAVAGLFLMLHIVAAIWSGNNSWISVTSFVLLIATLPVFLINSSCMHGQKWAGRIYVFSVFALLLLTIPGGQSGWLTITGSSPLTCDYVTTEYVESRSNTSEFYRFRCDGELLRYDPNFVGTAELTNGRLQLVTDRTGLTNPLRPQEVPGILGSLFLGVFTVHAGSLAVLVASGFTRKKKT